MRIYLQGAILYRAAVISNTCVRPRLCNNIQPSCVQTFTRLVSNEIFKINSITSILKTLDFSKVRKVVVKLTKTSKSYFCTTLHTALNTVNMLSISWNELIDWLMRKK